MTVVVLYLTIGFIIHKFIFPEPEPDYASYFGEGKQFYSKLEGFKQQVLNLQNDHVMLEITLDPHAAGPPQHVHETFDEKFTVVEGTLSIMLMGQKQRFTVGQTVTIPKGAAHKPFNETDTKVVLRTPAPGLPQAFVFGLSQLYGYWDAAPANSKPPKILLALSVLGDSFDSYPTENAPPKPMLKLLKLVLAPTARLLGYTKYNPQFAPR